ncbi:hypothetical protein CQY20_32610 [Mycolicibacterium agri]|uniref:Membrane protein n=1 Tax=Mycolicibacterium agri TaxID=36811 RepID=A0A2A7MNM6_MYCAG|nr:PDGLE domain-containing protein [Mycolicibacterium agri]PEG33093.1 hypothetical protein CQY20_32610 [Mycolicibacterium agri]GFG49691.1 membrane protein [Mycolicibacterium agri]
MTRRRGMFWAIFAVVTLVVAGGVSYFASSSPDGLDSATLQGCQVIENGGEEVLTGDCIAQHASDHPLSASPLADYTVAGHEWSGGLAGVIGVAVTLAVAGAAFWAISRSKSRAAGRE